METKLFFISLAMLAYTLLLKRLKKAYGGTLPGGATAASHMAFYAIVGVVAGMVFSTMSNNPDLITRYSVVGACIGAGFAFLHFFMQNSPEKHLKLAKSDLEWADTSWSAIFLASLLMFFVVQAFKIPSGSMRMTLLEGDHLFVNKFIYGIHVPFSAGKRVLRFKQVKHRDIVIFACPPEALTPLEKQKGIKKDFIKRAIGLPGDTIQVINKKVYVNGAPQDEPYTRFDDIYTYPEMQVYKSTEEYQRNWENGQFVNLTVRDNFGPVTVPQGHYFVMGDNRDRSFDSRFWGPLSDKRLKGQSLVVYWPPNRVKVIK